MEIHASPPNSNWPRVFICTAPQRTSNAQFMCLRQCVYLSVSGVTMSQSVLLSLVPSVSLRILSDSHS